MATRRGRRAPTRRDGVRWRAVATNALVLVSCVAVFRSSRARNTAAAGDDWDGRLRARRGRLETTTPTTPTTRTRTRRGETLYVSSHGAFVALDATTRARRVLHEGRGAYYGTFASDRAGEAWVVARGDANETRGRDGGRLRRDCCEEALLRIDLTSGDVLEERSVESKFTHDATRRLRGGVFVADTGRGRILELEYPSMKTRYVATLTVREHVNTVLPANVDEYGEHAVWAVLHNLGPSEVALIDVETGAELAPRLRNVGKKSHGLVSYDGKFLMLNSGEGELILVDPATDEYEVLWREPSRTFMKGLVVVDEVAYIGVSVFGTRAERADPEKTSDVVAFDLRRRDVLWRETIQTHGLLNSLFVDRRAGEQARWLDLRKKAFPLTARSMDALLIEHDAVDIRLLREYVDKLPKDAFTQNAQRDNAFLDGRTKNQQAIKPGVDTMHLIFSDRSGEEIFLFPYWEKFRPYVTPLLTSLFTRQLGVEDPTKHIVRLQIAVMNAGAMIHTHVDSGPWATRNHRFHIPIVVPPEMDAAQLIISPPGMDEVAVTLVEGRPFEINNAVEHTVRNHASSWRIHLLVDFSENEIPNSNLHALPVGAICSYATLGKDRCHANAMA